MFLLHKKDLEDLFSSSYFYQNQLIYAIDPVTQTYQTDQKFSNFIEYAKFIKQAFQNNQSIVVKGLENFNLKIKNFSLQFGADVDAHLYLTQSSSASSFDFHADDKEVQIVMVYGSKEFTLIESGVQKKYLLHEGHTLRIPKGVLHRAKSVGPSALISFGFLEDEHYYVPGGLQSSDFLTSSEDSESHCTIDPKI